MTIAEKPDVWKATSLGSLCIKIGSGSTPRGGQSAYVESGTPLIRSMNVHFDQFKEEGLVFINYEAAEKLKSVEVFANDVLLNITGASIGRVNLAPEKYAGARVNQHVSIIRPVKGVEPSFIRYFISAPEQQNYINSSESGATRQALTKEKIEGFLIPLPPLAEQQEIADRLDTLLAQVDTLNGRLEALPAILKRFRQSVLVAAVSGKLTEEWRNENNVAGSSEKSLKEVVSSLDQGWSPKCINEPAKVGEWAVIKTSAVQNIRFESSENKTLPVELDARPNLGLLKNDILITRAGPRVRCGVTCIVDNDYPNLMICDKVYRVRVNQDKTLPIYLALLLNSPQYLDEIEKLKTGSSDSGMNLTQKKFFGLRAPFPVIEEQTEIVRRVEQLFAFADQIEQRVQAAQSRVNHLTQSILAKAFRGELTADWREQHPELISGEHSASALLARIKAERAAQMPAKRTRKQKAGA